MVRQEKLPLITSTVSISHILKICPGNTLAQRTTRCRGIFGKQSCYFTQNRDKIEYYLGMKRRLMMIDLT